MPEQQPFVRVRDGKVQFFRAGYRQPSVTFGSRAVSAIVQGDEVFVQCENGSTQVWRISPNGTGVSGPTSTIR